MSFGFSTSASRRSFLASSGMGFGALALNAMLHTEQSRGASEYHHAPFAKHVIWLFMEGGPSHLDLVDPKPLLNKLSGKPLPSSFQEPITAMGEKGAPAFGIASKMEATRREWIMGIGLDAKYRKTHG